MESFKYGTTFDGIWGEQAVPGCGSVQAGTQMNSSLVLYKYLIQRQKRWETNLFLVSKASVNMLVKVGTIL